MRYLLPLLFGLWCPKMIPNSPMRRQHPSLLLRQSAPLGLGCPDCLSVLSVLQQLTLRPLAPLHRLVLLVQLHQLSLSILLDRLGLATL
jgi:hypothetical protein